MRREAGLSLIPVVIILAFFWIIYQPAIIHPNNHLFSTTGDGLSGYFTNAWHSRYDSGMIHHSGMNYPYGETIFNTSAPPAIAWLVKLTGSREHSAGILNILIILGQAFTGMFLYLILRNLNSSKLPAIAGAVSITLLNPQVWRIAGHYGLAFSLIIPAILYFILMHLKDPEKHRWSLGCGLVILLSCFIHPYLSVIAASGSILMLFSFAVINKKLRQISLYLKPLLAILVPLVFYILLTEITDNHLERPVERWGFFYYTSHPFSILFPSWMLEKLEGFAGVPLSWEGLAYVGLVTLLVFAVAGWLLASRKMKLREIAGPVLPMVIAGSLLLIFSLGLPFRFRMEILLDYIPFVNQFRAPGRFAWFFYFAATITAWYFIGRYHTWLLNRQRKTAALLTVIFSAGLMIAEALPLHKRISEVFNTGKNIFLQNQLPAEIENELKKIDPAKYQALIPLPWFFIGSEHFQRPGTEQSIQLGFLTSFHTGIPLKAGMLARTSLHESKVQVSFLTPGFLRKEVPVFPSEKPFLIACTGEEISDFEKILLAKASSVNGSSHFYELPFSAIHQPDTAWYHQQYRKHKNHLLPNGQWNTYGNMPLLIYDDFDSQASVEVFEGSGAFSGLADNIIVKEIDGKHFKPGIAYNISFWYWNAAQRQTQVLLRLEHVYDDHGRITYMDPKTSEVIAGEWSLVSSDFSVNGRERFIRLSAFHHHHRKNEIYIDNLLIRPSEASVYRQSSDSVLFFGNIPVPVW